MKVESTKLAEGKKVYFASDFHLGVPDYSTSLKREQKIVRWLDSIKPHAHMLVLVGDLFDFWFEYKHVVPKGYIRFLSKLTDLSESGVQIFVFTGNHDLWFQNYLPNEIGVEILKGPTSFSISEKNFFVAHGDGLGKGQSKFKFVKWFFTNPFCQWMFRWLHPDIGIGLANFWSLTSKNRGDDPEVFHEKLMEYSNSIQHQHQHDFYIYGDCHDATVRKLDDSKYVNLGEWMKKCTYAEFDGEDLSLKAFEG